MSLPEELTDLAGQLAGTDWQHTLPDDFTPEQQAAYDRASQEEKNLWLETILDMPIIVDHPDVNLLGHGLYLGHGDG